MEEKGYEILSDDLAMVPMTTTRLTDPDQLKLMGKLLDADVYKRQTVESIAEITPEMLYDSCKAFYAPGNMVLAAAGDTRCV